MGRANLSGRANSLKLLHCSICAPLGEAGDLLAYPRAAEERMASDAINRLLVVDDEAAQVEALCRTLEDEGYSVTGFTGTGPALAALRGGSFDIVLTDLTMPGMDGVAFLNAAREIDPRLAG